MKLHTVLRVIGWLSFALPSRDAGEVFTRAKPRLAVYSHAPKTESVITQTRRTYAGPLQGAEDMLTIEIGEKIDVRHFSR